MKSLLLFLLFALPLRAQSVSPAGGYVLTDTSGHIVKQFYYNGTDSLPPAAHSIASLTPVQAYYKGSLKWTGSAWLYSGSAVLPVSVDPLVADSVALRTAGFTAAQASAVILILKPN
jgi:hypothetical protein